MYDVYVSYGSGEGRIIHQEKEHWSIAMYKWTQPNIDTFTVRTKTIYSCRLKQVPTEQYKLRGTLLRGFILLIALDKLTYAHFSAQYTSLKRNFWTTKKKQNIAYTNIDHALRTLSNLFFSHSIKIKRKVFHTTKVKPSSQFTKCLRSFFYFRRIFEGFSILD